MNIVRHFIRGLVAIALMWQSAMPFAHALSAGDGIDVHSLICTTPGQPPAALSAEMAAHLAELFGSGEDSELPVSDHCPHCVLVSAVPLPQVDTAERFHVRRAPLASKHSLIQTIHAPRGPPVGATGPPSFI
ncbi:MAG: DUF2946 family protein [Pseudomonadota bacterium]